MTSVDRVRRRRISEVLGAVGAGGWVAWRPHELVMALGYQPYWNLSLALMPREGEPVLWVPKTEPRDRLPEQASIVEYPWGAMDEPAPFDALLRSIREVIDDRGLRGEALAVIGNPGGGTLGMMSAELPGWEIDLPAAFDDLTDAGCSRHDDALLALYTRKTDAEARRIGLANRVAGIGLERFFQMLEPGCTEAEIAGEVERAIRAAMCADGVEHARAWAMVQSGPNTIDAGRYNRTTDRALRHGDLVQIELATCVNGYWSDLTRSALLGAGGEHARLLKTIREAQRCAVEAVRPRVPMTAIDAAARQVVEAAGFGKGFTHPTGHHVGLRYHDPGPPLAPGADALLEPGMVITIEPGAYHSDFGGGCRWEDNVLVTEDGGHVLSHFHFDPPAAVTEQEKGA